MFGNELLVLTLKFELGGWMAKKLRGKAYYNERLRREAPALHADVLSGKMTINQAAIEAGLKRKPTRGDVLIRNYKLASPAERRQFSNWFKAHRVTKKVTPAPIADGAGKLVATAVTFVANHLRIAGISPGRFLSTIGKYKNFDSRMSQAVLKGRKLPPDILADLEVWLRRSGYA